MVYSVFHARVAELIAQVPAGKVTTYGGLASGYHGGREAQAEHLVAEGVTCTDFIVDDFKERRWKPLS